MIDRERIADVLLDAAIHGDGPAARKHGCSRRTVERYRAMLREDRDLAAFVGARIDEHEGMLADLRVRFLRKALAEMERRLSSTDTTLPEIAEAVKVVGELHQVAEAMGDVGSDGRDPEADEAPGDGIASASSAPH